MSDPQFTDLLEKYWSVAYQQGTEGRSHDDETGSAQDAEHALHQYVNRLTRELAEARDTALEEAWQAIKAREAEYEASFEANEFKGMTLAAIAALASAAAKVRALKEKP